MKEIAPTEFLNQLLPTGKMWLVQKGCLTRSTHCLGLERPEVEYQWTEKGLRWLDSLKGGANAVPSDVPMQRK